MENIFEQMRRYKGKNEQNTSDWNDIFSFVFVVEEADQLTGDERKQFAEKV